MYRKYFQPAKQLTNLSISLNKSVFLKANYENHTSRRWAGHSKWQNIKSTKEAMDGARSKAFSKITRLIGPIVREGGDDMTKNSKLRALWEEAQKLKMPKATFDNRVKAEKNQTVDKPYWTVFSGPKGVVLGFEVIFSNKSAGFLQGKFSSQVKKLRLKMEPYFEDFCCEKGLIITDPLPNVDSPYETAVDHAIEIGADEVFEGDDKTLIFECLPDRLDTLTQKLENKGYNILSSTTELDFKEFINLTENEIEDLETVINALKSRHSEIIRASYNLSRS